MKLSHFHGWKLPVNNLIQMQSDLEKLKLKNVDAVIEKKNAAKKLRKVVLRIKELP